MLKDQKLHFRKEKGCCFLGRLFWQEISTRASEVEISMKTKLTFFLLATLDANGAQKGHLERPWVNFTPTVAL